MCLSKLFGKKSASDSVVNRIEVSDTVVPLDDPMVKASNYGNGLVMSWEADKLNPSHWWLKYQNGREHSLGLAGDPSEFIQNGIFLNTSRRLGVVSDVRRGNDLSKYTDQEIFEAKVYLGQIIVRK